MSPAHTPSRLHTFTLYAAPELRDEVGDFVAAIGNGGPRSVANARRLAACWNACQGIPTEQLELAASWGDIIKAAVVSVPPHTGDAICTSLDQ